MISAALSAVQVQLFLVLCYARKFSSAVRGRIDSFSWETVAPLNSSLPNPSDPSLRLIMFVKNSVRRMMVHHKQSVMMVLDVEAGLVLFVSARSY